MVEVDDGLAGGCARVLSGLALLGGETVEAEEVAVFCEDDVLLVVVAKDLAEFLKVLCAADALCETVLVGFGDRRADDEVEEMARAVVEPFDDGLWEKRDNEGEDGLKEDEEAAADEGSVVARGETADERQSSHGRRSMKDGLSSAQSSPVIVHWDDVTRQAPYL